MTVEEFLKNHPEGGLQVTNGYAWPLVLDGGKPVSADGYTDGVLLGPDVKLSKKREVIWTAWMDSSHMLLEKPYDIREHASDKNDEVVAVRYGKYIDAPEDSEDNLVSESMSLHDILEYGEDEKSGQPELSQFLPDGWEWVYDKKYKEWGCAGNGYTFWCWSYDTKAFIDEGCLPPSEGGGFLKHKSGYPLPENLTAPAALLYGDGSILTASCTRDPRLNPENSSTYWENRSLPAHCTIVGYRPRISRITNNKKDTK